MKLAAAALLTLVLAAPGAARAGESPQSAHPGPLGAGSYDDTVTAALAEYERGNWAEARALFLAAHALRPSARSLRALGKTAFELREYVTALRELTASLAHPERPLDDALRAEVLDLGNRARAFVGRFAVDLVPREATLVVDGAPAERERDGSLLLGLGRHSLEATATGFVRAERVLEVRGRDDAQLEVHLSRILPPPAPEAEAAAEAPRGVSFHQSTTEETRSPDRFWTWIAAGGAVAAGGAAVGFQVFADASYDDLVRRCRSEAGGACAPGTVDASRLDTLEGLTVGSAITAGVATVATVILYFVEGGEAPPAARSGSLPSVLTGRF